MDFFTLLFVGVLYLYLSPAIIGLVRSVTFVLAISAATITLYVCCFLFFHIQTTLKESHGTPLTDHP